MKLLKGTPISTRNQFSAGGNMMPIVTKNSSQSVSGVQQMGTSVGTTKLGAYRMGDSDGNAPPSAIYPGDIFSPQPARTRQYSDVMFQSVGNRTFQPEDSDLKLHALIKKYGDQKFKAQENEKFAEYFRIKELARMTDDASRNAGIEQLGQSREIMRNLVDTRRKQNDDDYMRKMLDSGLSVEDAQDEIENVRRANALKESRTVDDRPYQAKLLISRIAGARGMLSQVKDTLTQSGNIELPQDSEAVQSAAGNPGEGFGTSPLDLNRIMMTPAFYKKFGKKTLQSQESQQEMDAINNLISTGQAGDVTSFSVFKGLQRADEIQRTREFAASKLESLRKRGSKIMLPIAPINNSLFEPLMRQIYGTKKPGEETYFTPEDSQTLTHTQSIIALNQIFSVDASGSKYKEAHRFLQQYKVLDDNGKPVKETFEIIRGLITELTKGETVNIPFVGKTISFDQDNLNEVGNALNLIRGNKNPDPTYRQDAKAYMEELQSKIEIPRGPGPPPPIATRVTSNTAVPQVDIGQTDLADLEEAQSVQVPMAPQSVQSVRSNVATAPGPRKTLSNMNKDELVAEAERLGLDTSGTKAQLKTRIGASRN
jgi:hypothetical protein